MVKTFCDWVIRHSDMAGEFVIKPSKLGGNGLFAVKAFPKGSVLMRLDGVKINGDEAGKLPDNDRKNLLQIGTDLFLDLRGRSHFFINHSCSPNCYVKVLVGTAFLMSAIPIGAGSEILIDASLTNLSLGDLTECRCGSFGCRKTISTFQSLPEKTRNRYIELGMVPKFVLGK